MFKSVKIVKDMARPRNRHRPEGTKEAGQLNAIEDPGLDPGTEKVIGRKTGDI